MFAIVLLSWGGSQMGLEICSRVGFNRDTLPTRWGTQLNGNGSKPAVGIEPFLCLNFYIESSTQPQGQSQCGSPRSA